MSVPVTMRINAHQYEEDFLPPIDRVSDWDNALWKLSLEKG
jgi:hypothetical protein